MRILLAAVFCAIALTSPVMAQDRAFVQVAARPTLDGALNDLRNFDRSVEGLGGFRMRGGWYALAIGPYSLADAEAELAGMLAAGTIPADSFIALPDDFRRQFWPSNGRALSRTALLLSVSSGDPVAEAETVEPEAEVIAVGPETEAEVVDPPETLAQARAGERRLNREEREDLQRALAWFGHYTSAIDGDIGPGSRAAMAKWQVANLVPETGVLTTKQRAKLLGDMRAQLSALGLATVTDAASGIEIEMPSGQVAYEKTRAPFVHYSGEGDNPARVVLISQPGGLSRLKSLFAILPTLEMVPAGAKARLRRDSFVIEGSNDVKSTYVEARLTDDGIKGFALEWPLGLPGNASRIADAMRSSFTPIEGRVLEDDAGGLRDQDVDLLAGLQIRRPAAVRSGIFVDERGKVLTVADGLSQCSRLTIGEDIAALLSPIEDQPGLALITPEIDAAPIDVATISQRSGRIGASISVAGYAYEGRLPAPTVTPGRLDDVRGLNGEEDISRITLTRPHGGEGGPILDATGSVIGILMQGEQGLPAGVRTAISAPAMLSALRAAGVQVASLSSTTNLDPVDLEIHASDITAMVACWNN